MRARGWECRYPPPALRPRSLSQGAAIWRGDSAAARVRALRKPAVCMWQLARAAEYFHSILRPSSPNPAPGLPHLPSLFKSDIPSHVSPKSPTASLCFGLDGRLNSCRAFGGVELGRSVRRSDPGEFFQLGDPAMCARHHTFLRLSSGPLTLHPSAEDLGWARRLTPRVCSPSPRHPFCISAGRT